MIWYDLHHILYFRLVFLIQNRPFPSLSYPFDNSEIHSSFASGIYFLTRWDSSLINFSQNTPRTRIGGSWVMPSHVGVIDIIRTRWGWKLVLTNQPSLHNHKNSLTPTNSHKLRLHRSRTRIGERHVKQISTSRTRTGARSQANFNKRNDKDTKFLKTAITFALSNMSNF